MAEFSLIVDRRFRGPPTSCNGGYCAGLIAEHLGDVVEVTLRLPPPLEQPLRVEVEEARVRLFGGEQLLAEAREVALELEVPPSPGFERAELASRAFAGFSSHIFPGCFVCGTERARDDGLRIFAGPIEGLPLMAAPFVPDRSLVDGAEQSPLRAAMVWAALDCPGYFAAADGGRALLGRMTAEVRRSPLPGERCLVIAWPLGRDGRKIHAGTALYTASGELLGRARQTWISQED
jgi:hypothetical protein